MRRAACLLALIALLAGCTSVAAKHPQTDPDKVNRYFTDLTAAGRRGPEAQQAFLRATQHPDFAGKVCDLKGLTLDIYAAMSTLRPDPHWAPEGESPPRGLVYVLGVSLTVRRAGATVGEQVDSERVVLLDGRTYGFPPCPSTGK